MSITVHPYKLTLREMEARLEPGLALLPGQLLRFEGVVRAYGEVSGVRILSTDDANSGCLVRIRLLHGQPDLTAQTVAVLNDDQMAAEVQRLLPSTETPLRLGDAFVGDLHQLGALTLIEGDDFVLKYETLALLLAGILPYQPVLVVDPLGVFEPDAETQVHKAGQDLRLSVQAVGSKRFLGTFGELFPDSLREAALSAMAEHLPAVPDFVGFNRLLNLESAAEVPLKNLILQSYYATAQAKVFADQEVQVFDLVRVLTGHLNVLDLSGLPEPWKRLFYEEVCTALFAGNLGRVTPVLLYPETYLANPVQWLQKADEAGVQLVAMASPYCPEGLRERADNLLLADAADQVYLEGDLTLGLPVRFALPEVPPQTEAPAFLPSVEKTSGTVESVMEPVLTSTSEVVTELNWTEPSASVAEEPTPGPESAVSERHAESHAELFPSSAEAPGIVDLSAPRPEPPQPFMTESLPSELPPSRPPEPVLNQPEPSGQAGVDSYGGTGLNYPDAEEGAWEAPLSLEAIYGSPYSSPGVGSALPSAGEPSGEILPEAAWLESALPEVQSPEPMPLNPSEPALNMPLGSPAESQAQVVPMSMSPEHVQPIVPAQPQLAELRPEPPLEQLMPSLSVPPMGGQEAVSGLFDRDEFSFDVNLDQKPEAQWAGDFQFEAPPEAVIADAVSQSMQEFSQLEPVAPVLPPAPELQPMSTVSGELGMDVAFPTDESAWTPIMESSHPPEQPSGLVHPSLEQADLSDLRGEEPGAMPTSEAVKAKLSMEEESIPIVAKSAGAETLEQAGFQAGERVRHETYGVGVVNKVIPMEAGNVILNITFDTVGKRLLDPALCKLGREGAGDPTP